MIQWCSSCRKFLGETPHYEDLSVHLIECQQCRKANPQPTNVDYSFELRKIMLGLSQAGLEADFEKGALLIRRALQIGFRPIDVVMGILTPMLTQIGAQWEKGEITVAHEHRFTSLVELLFAMLAREIQFKNQIDWETAETKMFLFNAEGNRHNLGIRILEVWFRQFEIGAKAFYPTPELPEILKLISIYHPKFVCISICMEDQVAWLKHFLEEVEKMKLLHLQILVGGHGVRKGLVPSLPGMTLVPDINFFQEQ